MHAEGVLLRSHKITVVNLKPIDCLLLTSGSLLGAMDTRNLRYHSGPDISREEAIRCNAVFALPVLMS